MIQSNCLENKTLSKKNKMYFQSNPANRKQINSEHDPEIDEKLQINVQGSRLAHVYLR